LTTVVKDGLGLPGVHWVIRSFIKYMCDAGISVFSQYKRAICEGMIKTQLDEAIFPILVNELLSEESMCTFVFELCNQDKWRAMDVN